MPDNTSPVTASLSVEEMIQIADVAATLLKPVFDLVVRAIANGQNPLDALAAERVENIIPTPLKLEIARKLERLARSAPAAT